MSFFVELLSGKSEFCCCIYISLYLTIVLTIVIFILLRDELPITDMPPVLLSTLIASQEKEMVDHRKLVKAQLIDAAFNEISENGLERCNVPTKEELMSTSTSNTLNWDAVESFHS